MVRKTRKSRKSISLNGGNDLLGNSSAFVNVNFYKSTFTQLKFAVNDYRYGNEATYFIIEESYYEQHTHII
jgi:hypothetical protein